jgi:hypothetical protein
MTGFVVHRYTNIFRGWALSFLFFAVSDRLVDEFMHFVTRLFSRRCTRRFLT